MSVIIALTLYELININNTHYYRSFELFTAWIFIKYRELEYALTSFD